MTSTCERAVFTAGFQSSNRSLERFLMLAFTGSVGLRLEVTVALVP